MPAFLLTAVDDDVDALPDELPVERPQQRAVIASENHDHRCPSYGAIRNCETHGRWRWLDRIATMTPRQWPHSPMPPAVLGPPPDHRRWSCRHFFRAHPALSYHRGCSDSRSNGARHG